MPPSPPCGPAGGPERLPEAGHLRVLRPLPRRPRPASTTSTSGSPGHGAAQNRPGQHGPSARRSRSSAARGFGQRELRRPHCPSRRRLRRPRTPVAAGAVHGGGVARRELPGHRLARPGRAVHRPLSGTPRRSRHPPAERTGYHRDQLGSATISVGRAERRHLHGAGRRAATGSVRFNGATSAAWRRARWRRIAVIVPARVGSELQSRPSTELTGVRHRPATAPSVSPLRQRRPLGAGPS